MRYYQSRFMMTESYVFIFEEDEFEAILYLLCDEDRKQDRTRGLRPGRSANVDRDRATEAATLFKDCFSSDPVYP